MMASDFETHCPKVGTASSSEVNRGQSRMGRHLSETGPEVSTCRLATTCLIDASLP